MTHDRYDPTTRAIVDQIAERDRLRAAVVRLHADLAAMTTARDEACAGWERQLCLLERVPGPAHHDRYAIEALRAIGSKVVKP